jgi:hypothetical protein
MSLILLFIYFVAARDTQSANRNNTNRCLPFSQEIYNPISSIRWIS